MWEKVAAAMELGEMPEKMAVNVPRRAHEVAKGADGEQPMLEKRSPRGSRLQMPRRLTGQVLRSGTRTRLISGGVLAALLAGLVVVFVRSQPPDLQIARATTGTIAVTFTTSGTL